MFRRKPTTIMDRSNNNSWFTVSPNTNNPNAVKQQQQSVASVRVESAGHHATSGPDQQSKHEPQQKGQEPTIEEVQTPGVPLEYDQQVQHNPNLALVPSVTNQPNAGQILLKMLVPAYAAGSVIGKNGQTITHLQKETGVSIKLSKAKDFYPGTTERIALIQGKYEGVRIVLHFIIDKIYEFPIPKDMVMQNAERAKQVKTIVPNTTAGLIIGKKGATIKTIMEQSKAKVQLTQKPESPNMQQLLERVITVCGEREQLYAASQMILTRIRDDPQSSSCPNLSYQNVTGLVANANPTGSPYAPVNEATLLTAANGLGLAAAAAAAAGHPIQIPAGMHAIPLTATTAANTALMHAASGHHAGALSNNPHLNALLAASQPAAAHINQSHGLAHHALAAAAAQAQASQQPQQQAHAHQPQGQTYEVIHPYQIPASSASHLMQQYKPMM